MRSHPVWPSKWPAETRASDDQVKGPPVIGEMKQGSLNSASCCELHELLIIISSPLTICGYPNFPWQIGAFSGKIPQISINLCCVWFYGQNHLSYSSNCFSSCVAPGVVNNSSEKVVRPKSTPGFSPKALRIFFTKFKHSQTHGFVILWIIWES